MKGPELGQDVFVVFPAAGPLNGRVDGVREEGIYLTVWQGEGERITELRGEASLQFTNRRGVCRLDGVLHGPDREHGHIHFEPTAAVRVIQRRDYARVDAVVSVSYEGRAGQRIDTHTTNLSGGGFALASPEDIELGDRLHFTLYLTEDGGLAPLELFGQAVRKTDGAGIGVAIVEIAPPDRERLIRFVFDRERLARQMLGRR